MFFLAITTIKVVKKDRNNVCFLPDTAICVHILYVQIYTCLLFHEPHKDVAEPQLKVKLGNLSADCYMLTVYTQGDTLTAQLVKSFTSQEQRCQNDHVH